jgi:F-type H+-transporting ATPase subunit epsilon
MAGPKTFRCEILTPEATLLAAEAESVVFPAADGLVGVLPRRAPLAAVVGKGQVTVRSAQGESRFQVKGGVAHMQGNTLTILAEECTKQQ